MKEKQKSSLLSTEFILSMIIFLTASWLFYKGTLTKEDWSHIMMAIGPGYAVSRGIAKMGNRD